jgi:hypothetical protein
MQIRLNKAISKELGIYKNKRKSEKTIKKILKQTKLHSRADLLME